MRRALLTLARFALDTSAVARPRGRRYRSSRVGQGGLQGLREAPGDTPARRFALRQAAITPGGKLLTWDVFGEPSHVTHFLAGVIERGVARRQQLAPDAPARSPAQRAGP